MALTLEEGGSYRSFASDLINRVSTSLELSIHGTATDDRASTGLKSIKAKLDNTTAKVSTGQCVLNMRFALGADDSTYLNSAVMMLFTGTEMDNSQLNLSDLTPPDVQMHIRKAVIANLKSERLKRKDEAVRKIASLSDQLVWYLSFSRVRKMLRVAFEHLFKHVSEEDKKVANTLLDDLSGHNYKLLYFYEQAGSAGVYYVLLLLEAVLDSQGSVGSAISTVITDMVGTDVDDAGDKNNAKSSQFDRLNTSLFQVVKDKVEGYESAGASLVSAEDSAQKAQKAQEAADASDQAVQEAEALFEQAFNDNSEAKQRLKVAELARSKLIILNGELQDLVEGINATTNEVSISVIDANRLLGESERIVSRLADYISSNDAETLPQEVNTIATSLVGYLKEKIERNDGRVSISSAYATNLLVKADFLFSKATKDVEEKTIAFDATREAVAKADTAKTVADNAKVAAEDKASVTAKAAAEAEAKAEAAAAESGGEGIIETNAPNLQAVSKMALKRINNANPSYTEQPSHPYTHYCVRRGLVGLRGPLHDAFQTLKHNNADYKDDQEETEQSDKVDVFNKIDAKLSYELPKVAIPDLTVDKDPCNPATAIATSYKKRKTVNHIVHDSSVAQLKRYSMEAVTGLRGDYAMVPLDPSGSGLEARFSVRWKPENEMGEHISKAAAMQHASVRCESMSTYHENVKKDPVLASIYALMAAGFELRRLAPQAHVIHTRRRQRGNSQCQHSRYDDFEKEQVAPELYTTPHSNFGTNRFAAPYNAGYATEKSVKPSSTPPVMVTTSSISSVISSIYPNTPSDMGSSSMSVPIGAQPSGEVADNTEAYWGSLSVNEEDGNVELTWEQASQMLIDLAHDTERESRMPDAFLGPETFDDVYEFRSRLVANPGMNLVPQQNARSHLSRLQRPHMHAIVHYALLYAHALHDKECFVDADDAMSRATHTAHPAASPVEKDQRVGLWNDMLREVSISNDRLYTFVRTLSGAMGEEASVLLSQADETAQKKARELEAERKEIAKRVSDFQSKIVEIIIGGIVKTSHLEMRPDGSDGEFQVVDSEMAKELRALASGESGRPFFEANVAIQGMINQSRNDKASLGAVVRGLGGVVSTLYEQLQTELSTVNGTSTSGLGMLAQPRNSFMVHLRDDATAAIRVAYDRFSREFNGRSIRLYELVEGCDPHLSLRFAEFVANVLIQVRSSSGASALYVSEGTRRQTALQARASLVRLTNRAAEYTRFASPPNFHDNTADGIQNARLAYFGNVVQGHGVASQKSVILRVEGRSDTEGGWKGYPLPYRAGMRYHPYA